MATHFFFHQKNKTSHRIIAVVWCVDLKWKWKWRANRTTKWLNERWRKAQNDRTIAAADECISFVLMHNDERIMCVFIEAKKKTFPQRLLLLLWLSWLQQTKCWFKQIELLAIMMIVWVFAPNPFEIPAQIRRRSKKKKNEVNAKFIRANSLWIFIRDFSFYICQRNLFFALVFMPFRCIVCTHCAHRDIAENGCYTFRWQKHLAAFRPMRKRFCSYLHEMVSVFIITRYAMHLSYIDRIWMSGSNRN